MKIYRLTLIRILITSRYLNSPGNDGCLRRRKGKDSLCLLRSLILGHTLAKFTWLSKCHITRKRIT